MSAPPGRDERRPTSEPAPAKTSAKKSSTIVQVSGRVVLDLGRYADDVGFVGDGARHLMSWPELPDGVALIIDIGGARAWSSWLFEPLGEGPRWARVEVRGTGEVGRAVREIRAILEAVE